MQALVMLIGSPLAATVLALLARARPLVVIGSAVVAELTAYLGALWWSRRAVQRALMANQDLMMAQMQPAAASRATAIAFLCLFAALVSALGLGVRFLWRGGRG